MSVAEVHIIAAFLGGFGLGYMVRGVVQIMWARSRNAVSELVAYRRKLGYE
jgi:hypothetical protein